MPPPSDLMATLRLHAEPDKFPGPIPDLGTHAVMIDGIPCLLDLWSNEVYSRCDPPPSDWITPKGGMGIRARLRFL